MHHLGWLDAPLLGQALGEDTHVLQQIVLDALRAVGLIAAGEDGHNVAAPRHHRRQFADVNVLHSDHRDPHPRTHLDAVEPGQPTRIVGVFPRSLPC